MNSIEINVKDVIGTPSALTREQGKILLDEIQKVFAAKKKVILDFADIESIITPFLNVAIGKLYEFNTSEMLKQNLEIRNIPKGKAASFNLVIENAKKFYSNQSEFSQKVKDVIE